MLILASLDFVKSPDGIRLHIADVYVEELVAAVGHESHLCTIDLLALLRPFFPLLQVYHNQAVITAILESVIDPALKACNSYSGGPKASEILTALFSLAAEKCALRSLLLNSNGSQLILCRRSTSSKNRKRLYAFYRKHASDFGLSTSFELSSSKASSVGDRVNEADAENSGQEPKKMQKLEADGSSAVRTCATSPFKVALSPASNGKARLEKPALNATGSPWVSCIRNIRYVPFA